MGNNIKKIIKSYAYPIYLLLKEIIYIYGKHNPMWLANWQYRKAFGKSIDWENPIEMNEKIRWMQFYTDTSKWSLLADKYRVRKYLIEKGYENILVPLLGVWEDSKDIDFSILPNKFVLKVNNGSGDIIIIKNKNKVNLEKIRKRLQKLLDTPFGYKTAELHYLSIKPCIIAEELLNNDPTSSSSLIDYKFFCTNGNPFCCVAYYDRDTNKHHMNSTIYDIKWNRHDEWRSPKIRTIPKDISCPKNIDKMIKICHDLASEFPFVRLDFYEVNEKLYFGEFTFTPAALSGGALNKKTCLEIGKLIKLL